MAIDMETNLYLTLDEARTELSRRWNDLELRNAIECDLGPQFVEEFRSLPHGVISCQLISPDNGLSLFFYLSSYVGTNAFAWEFHGDVFSRSSAEKQGLGRLRVTLGSSKMLIHLISFSASKRKQISDVTTFAGETLVAFHHRLMDLSGLDVERRDMTDWYKDIGKPADYYYPFLKHFVAHGVLFEVFDVERAQEESFTSRVVIPAFQRIKAEYGLAPMVCRLYPENQTDNEDFYWFGYPSHINEYLIRYAREQQFPIEEWHPNEV
jgi:hypothetical protein